LEKISASPVTGFFSLKLDADRIEQVIKPHFSTVPRKVNERTMMEQALPTVLSVLLAIGAVILLVLVGKCEICLACQLCYDQGINKRIDTGQHKLLVLALMWKHNF
jgi:hypothetical protein